MKSIAFFALTTLATAAFAVTPAPDPSIVISGTSNQTAALSLISVNNTSVGNTEAMQNLATNAGNVTIRGTSNQVVVGTGGNLSNLATGGSDAYASQNVSTNLGKVTVSGNSNQLTSLYYASVNNTAFGASSKAVQNIATNNACVVCQPTRRGHHD